MDAASPILVLAIVFWATLALFIAMGAAIYHWPELVGAKRRRGFDVLPGSPRAPRSR